MLERSVRGAAVICIWLFIMIQTLQTVSAQENIASTASDGEELTGAEVVVGKESNAISLDLDELLNREDVFVTPNGCVRDIKCSEAQINAKYRSADGSCNNINHPSCGKSGIPFIRSLRSDYDDGIQSLRGATSRTIPSPRQVSDILSRVAQPDNRSPISLMVMQWGQFLDHDLVFTPETELEESECCADGQDLTITDEECIRLDVTGDEFYSMQDVRCLRLARSLPVKSSCAPTRRREQINALTSYIDGSQVYGSTKREQRAVRTFRGGLLKVGAGEELQTTGCNALGKFNFLPSLINNGNEELFAGDRRAIEQPGLTSMHTLFVRAHNDIASKLRASCGRAKNCRDDRWLFEETRRIIGALIQHITYNEFLPQVLGSRAMREFHLNPIPSEESRYETGYNSELCASTPNVFAAAAFRFGHSLIPDVYNLKSGGVKLSENFDNTDATQTLGTYPSDFLQAITFARAEGMDHFIADSVRNTLNALPPFTNGSDLYARNIVRGRDHGIPSYNAWRRSCGFDVVSNLRDLFTVMPEQPARAFRQLYRSLREIDLFPALISETPENIGDGIAGPTLVCLLGSHFKNLKFADRYYYEGNSQPVPFTLRQLTAIRKTTLAAVLCAYTDTDRYQSQAFVTVRRGNRPERCSKILRQTVLDDVVQLFGGQDLSEPQGVENEETNAETEEVFF